jgi:hypothetical protein
MGLWLHADWDCWMLAAWIWRETSRIWRRMASPECDPWLILARRCTCRPKCKSLSPQHFSQPIQTTFNMFVSPYNFVSFSVEVFLTCLHCIALRLWQYFMTVRPDCFSLPFGVFCRPDTRHIFLDIGLGFHVEFTWQEALQFISVREARLSR